ETISERTHASVGLAVERLVAAVNTVEELITEQEEEHGEPGEFPATGRGREGPPPAAGARTATRCPSHGPTPEPRPQARTATPCPGRNSRPGPHGSGRQAGTSRRWTARPSELVASATAEPPAGASMGHERSRRGSAHEVSGVRLT